MAAQERIRSECGTDVQERILTARREEHEKTRSQVRAELEAEVAACMQREVSCVGDGCGKRVGFQHSNSGHTTSATGERLCDCILFECSFSIGDELDWRRELRLLRSVRFCTVRLHRSMGRHKNNSLGQCPSNKLLSRRRNRSNVARRWNNS